MRTLTLICAVKRYGHWAAGEMSVWALRQLLWDDRFLENPILPWRTDTCPVIPNEGGLAVIDADAHWIGSLFQGPPVDRIHPSEAAATDINSRVREAAAFGKLFVRQDTLADPAWRKTGVSVAWDFLGGMDFDVALKDAVEKCIAGHSASSQEKAVPCLVRRLPCPWRQETFTPLIGAQGWEAFAEAMCREKALPPRSDVALWPTETSFWRAFEPLSFQAAAARIEAAYAAQSLGKSIARSTDRPRRQRL